MAAIYSVKDDELHIWHNRMPKKDGSEPRLLILLILVPWVLIRIGGMALTLAAMLFVDGMGELMIQQNRGLPFLLVYDVFFTVFLVALICSQYTQIVFSPAKKEVYWKFLFFRRHMARFDEITEVKAESRKTFGFTRNSFSAVRRKGKSKGKGKKPIRISPTAGKTQRLSMYYHYVAPIANDMLQRSRRPGKSAEGADATPVYGEAVEIPVAEAEQYLRGGTASQRAGR